MYFLICRKGFNLRQRPSSGVFLFGRGPFKGHMVLWTGSSWEWGEAWHQVVLSSRAASIHWHLQPAEAPVLRVSPVFFYMFVSIIWRTVESCWTLSWISVRVWELFGSCWCCLCGVWIEMFLQLAVVLWQEVVLFWLILWWTSGWGGKTCGLLLLLTEVGQSCGVWCVVWASLFFFLKKLIRFKLLSLNLVNK